MEETRPDQVSLLVKASRDERPTKHTHGVVSTSRRETRGHSGVAWQHAPGTVPPSHNSWGALGSWIASDHLGLTSPHVLSGSGFCCISAAPGATPRALRSPLSALRCGSSLRTVRPGLRSRSRDKIRTFPRCLPAAADLVPGIRFSMSLGTNSRNPMRDTLPQVVIPTRASKQWDGLQTYMTSRTVKPRRHSYPKSSTYGCS